MNSKIFLNKWKFEFLFIYFRRIDFLGIQINIFDMCLETIRQRGHLFYSSIRANDARWRLKKMFSINLLKGSTNF